MQINISSVYMYSYTKVLATQVLESIPRRNIMKKKEKLFLINSFAVLDSFLFVFSLILSYLKKFLFFLIKRKIIWNSCPEIRFRR